MSICWRSLETSLVSCKVELSLRWIGNCVITTVAIRAKSNYTGADSAIFKIKDTKLYVPVVTLLIEDSTKLAKELSEGFKRIVYQNKYKVIDKKVVAIARANNGKKNIRGLIDSNYQGGKRLFVLAYNNIAGDDQEVSKKIFSQG